VAVVVSPPNDGAVPKPNTWPLLVASQ
jgi:hypothetical protein